MSLGAFEIALVALVFFAGGLVKGTLGLGLPVVAIPLLAPLIGLKVALSIFVVPAIATNLWQALVGPDLKGLLVRLWPFLAAAFAGIWIGTGILAVSDTAPFEMALGGLLILYAGIALATPQIPSPGRHEPWMGPVAGGLGGVVMGTTGLFIVPGVLYIQALGLDRDRFVQALGMGFITIATALGAGLAARAVLTGELAVLSLGAVIPTFAGLMLGTRLRGRISEALFRRIFFIALIGIGIYMILRAAAPPPG